MLELSFSRLITYQVQSPASTKTDVNSRVTENHFQLSFASILQMYFILQSNLKKAHRDFTQEEDWKLK